MTYLKQLAVLLIFVYLLFPLKTKNQGKLFIYFFFSPNRVQKCALRMICKAKDKRTTELAAQIRPFTTGYQLVTEVYLDKFT